MKRKKAGERQSECGRELKPELQTGETPVDAIEEKINSKNLSYERRKEERLKKEKPILQ